MTNIFNNNVSKKSDFNTLVDNFREYIAHGKSEEKNEKIIEELTSRNHHLSQFAYITSHNLRAPLSNLIGLIDILNYEHLDEYNKSIVDMFRESADKLNETIYDLTQMLNLKNTKNIKIENLNIYQIFKKVSHSFSPQIHTLGITIHTDFQQEMILFNKSYLESILTNLISNAIKYCSVNRPLAINARTLLNEDGDTVLTFSDNGMGIDLIKHKDRIFGLNERFHNHVNGNGVGLFITKTQITSLGGTIDVESEVDKGSTFIITIKK
ncbi:sensor histidine kinase [Pedobacter sp. AW31-3R]|uniref:sensor histidine kinase n=1 Tax=Pedobacter sp. AW31-3R TaxID=3445781 RepID=UPI003FA01906